MAEPFSITVPTNTLWLDATRKAQTAFTVSNMSGRALRGRVRFGPQDAAALPWLKLEGEAERDFAIAGTQQYTVHIGVPPTGAPGVYSFRLDVLDVGNTDEGLIKGPAVQFEVPAAVPVKPGLPIWIPIAAVAALLLLGVIIFAVISINSSQAAGHATETAVAAAATGTAITGQAEATQAAVQTQTAVGLSTAGAATQAVVQTQTAAARGTATALAAQQTQTAVGLSTAGAATQAAVQTQTAAARGTATALAAVQTQTAVARATAAASATAAAAVAATKTALARPPRLTGATVRFDTKNDDKDHDTRLNVTIYSAHGAILASKVWPDEGFPDNSTRIGALQITGQPTRADFSNARITIRIEPNGNDTWRFNWSVQLSFEDHPVPLDLGYLILSENRKTWSQDLPLP